MERATITVDKIYDNPKSIKIQTSRGNFYVAKRDGDIVDALKERGKYNIKYESSDFKGNTMNWIKVLENGGGEPVTQPVRPVAENPSAQVKPFDKDLHITALAILKSGIESGQVQVTKTDMWRTYKEAAALHRMAVQWAEMGYDEVE